MRWTSFTETLVHKSFKVFHLFCFSARPFSRLFCFSLLSVLVTINAP